MLISSGGTAPSGELETSGTPEFAIIFILPSSIHALMRVLGASFPLPNKAVTAVSESGASEGDSTLESARARLLKPCWGI